MVRGTTEVTLSSLMFFKQQCKTVLHQAVSAALAAGGLAESLNHSHQTTSHPIVQRFVTRQPVSAVHGSHC